VSTRPLLDRLGFAPGKVAHVWGLPETLAEAFAPCAPYGTGEGADWRLAFVPDAAAVDRAAGEVAVHYRRGQHLWFCYPKLSGRIRTDITRDKGWEPLVPLDLLPVTQVSVDETWSALRFRYRDEIKILTRKF
jgi:hypothetical protein